MNNRYKCTYDKGLFKQQKNATTKIENEIKVLLSFYKRSHPSFMFPPSPLSMYLSESSTG